MRLTSPEPGCHGAPLAIHARMTRYCQESRLMRPLPSGMSTGALKTLCADAAPHRIIGKSSHDANRQARKRMGGSSEFVPLTRGVWRIRGSTNGSGYIILRAAEFDTSRAECCAASE